jgi:formylglycine-generating enzyme required for sulfatase activity
MNMPLNKTALVLVVACITWQGAQAQAEDATPLATAATAKPSDEVIQALITKVRESMRPVHGGSFDMGDWGNEAGVAYDFEDDSHPVHKVTLDDFSMMAYKVTYADFDIFTDATGAERIDMDDFSLKYRAPRSPAGVSWFGAKAYCAWLGKLTHMHFDLPTEAQWEYAARSEGKHLMFSTDNAKIERGRNFPKDWVLGEKEPPLPDVGSFPSNPLGLYGMSENTGEWVNDWYDEKYYAQSPEKNPKGPVSGIKKVKRGSVGGSAEIAAAVFMRGKAVPQTVRASLSDDAPSRIIRAPLSGYSGNYNDNIRCAEEKQKNN